MKKFGKNLTGRISDTCIGYKRIINPKFRGLALTRNVGSRRKELWSRASSLASLSCRAHMGEIWGPQAVPSIELVARPHSELICLKNATFVSVKHVKNATFSSDKRVLLAVCFVDHRNAAYQAQQHWANQFMPRCQQSRAEWGEPSITGAIGRSMRSFKTRVAFRQPSPKQSKPAALEMLGGWFYKTKWKGNNSQERVVSCMSSVISLTNTPTLRAAKYMWPYRLSWPWNGEKLATNRSPQLLLPLSNPKPKGFMKGLEAPQSSTQTVLNLCRLNHMCESVWEWHNRHWSHLTRWTRRLEQSLEVYFQTALGINRNEETWDSLCEKITDTKAKYNDSKSGIWHTIWYKMGGYKDTLDGWTALIPEQYGLAVVKTGIAVIFKVCLENHWAFLMTWTFSRLTFTSLRNTQLRGETSSWRPLRGYGIFWQQPGINRRAFNPTKMFENAPIVSIRLSSTPSKTWYYWRLKRTPDVCENSSAWQTWLPAIVLTKM